MNSMSKTQLFLLPEHWQIVCRDNPETGMGWQQADIFFTDGMAMDNAIILGGMYILNCDPSKKVLAIAFHKSKAIEVKR